MEDRLHLVEVAVDSMHTMILADILPDIEQRLRGHPEPEFFQDLSGHRGLQGFTVVLPTAGQDKELPFVRANPHRENITIPENHRTGGRAHP